VFLSRQEKELAASEEPGVLLTRHDITVDIEKLEAN
jgi:hypothetical protein